MAYEHDDHLVMHRYQNDMFEMRLFEFLNKILFETKKEFNLSIYQVYIDNRHNHPVSNDFDLESIEQVMVFH